MGDSKSSSKPFTELQHFLLNVMRMQHIYQPIIIATLLNNGGKADSRDIAKILLQKDQSQIDYYQYVVDKSHPARVLRKHKVVSKNRGIYELSDFDDLTKREIATLTKICHEKIAKYMERRGSTVWEHRGRNRKAVPVSIRYEVLKRANNRCELCGASTDETRLDVDHITPHKLGGKDDLTNYQALCYRCNSNKRETDTTDFRGLLTMYEQREQNCLFCDVRETRDVLAQKTLAYVVADNFPVTEGHCLIIPKRHVKSYFQLTSGEVSACHRLLVEMREKLTQEDATIMGFNIGVNDGKTAGQSVFHCHTHLIPRRKSDANNPQGGVRHIIPGRGYYSQK